MQEIEDFEKAQGDFQMLSGGSLKTPMCSCNRKNVVFICQKRSCAHHEDQPVYCQICKDDERHDHLPVVRIRNWPIPTRDAPDSKWENLSSEVEKCVKQSIPKFKNYAPLIRYLENEIIKSTSTGAVVDDGNRFISKDFETLCGITNEIDYVLSTLSESDTLEQEQLGMFEVLAFDGDYKHISAIFNEISYLSNLNEDIIYRHYYTVLISCGVSEQPFVGFRRYHRDAYLRLKFRAINERIGYTLPEVPAPKIQYTFSEAKEEERKASVASSQVPPSNDDIEPPTLMSKVTYLQKSIEWACAKFSDIDKFRIEQKRAEDILKGIELKMRVVQTFKQGEYVETQTKLVGTFQELVKLKESLSDFKQQSLQNQQQVDKNFQSLIQTHHQDKELQEQLLRQQEEHAAQLLLQQQKEKEELAAQLDRLKDQQESLVAQKQELEQQKDQERKQMQSLFIKVAQEKVKNDEQNRLLALINAADRGSMQQHRFSRKTQRMTLILTKFDFDEYVQRQGMTMKIQKTIKLKFGQVNKRFVLINRNAQILTDDKVKEERREALSDQRSTIFMLWADEVLNKTIGLWVDAGKFTWSRGAPYQDLPRAVMVFIDRPDPSVPQSENDSGSFEFLGDLQARVDTRYNLMIRERGSQKDYQFYLRLYHQFDVYRTVQPGNSNE